MLKLLIILFVNIDFVLTQTLLFDNLPFKPSKNLEMLNSTTDYTLSTKRFDEGILSSY